MSAQKALHGSEADMRELLGGTTENRISLTRGLSGPPNILVLLASPLV